MIEKKGWVREGVKWGEESVHWSWCIVTVLCTTFEQPPSFLSVLHPSRPILMWSWPVVFQACRRAFQSIFFGHLHRCLTVFASRIWSFLATPWFLLGISDPTNKTRESVRKNKFVELMLTSCMLACAKYWQKPVEFTVSTGHKVNLVFVLKIPDYLKRKTLRMWISYVATSAPLLRL